MLKDSIIGLAIGIFVVSSIAWVSQWRRIRQRMKAKKAMRAESDARTDAPTWPI